MNLAHIFAGEYEVSKLTKQSLYEIITTSAFDSFFEEISSIIKTLDISSNRYSWNPYTSDSSFHGHRVGFTIKSTNFRYRVSFKRQSLERLEERILCRPVIQILFFPSIRNHIEQIHDYISPQLDISVSHLAKFIFTFYKFNNRHLFEEKETELRRKIIEITRSKTFREDLKKIEIEEKRPIIEKKLTELLGSSTSDEIRFVLEELDIREIMAS